MDCDRVWDWDELGPAEAPPDGLAEVVEVAGGAGAEVDVVVVDGVLVVEVAAAGDDDVAVVAGEVWAAPLDEVVAAEPPQPATIRISVSAARA